MAIRAAPWRELRAAVGTGAWLACGAAGDNRCGGPWRHRARTHGAARYRIIRARPAAAGRARRRLRIHGRRHDDASVKRLPQRERPVSFNTFGHLFRVTTFGESHG